MPEPTVSAGIVSGLVSYAERHGADRQMLLARAGIAAGELSDHDNRIALTAYMMFMRAAKELCNDPALALHYGETIDMSEVSIVGLLMNASRTMGEAFAQMQRYGKLALEVDCTGAGERFQLQEKDGQLWMVDTRTEPNSFPELTESSFVRLVCGPRRFLEKPHVHEIHVTHDGPDYRDEYERIFQCPVTFSSHWNAMRLDPQVISWPVALQPQYVFGILTDHADSLLENLKISGKVRSEVENLLIPILHTGTYSAESISSTMGFSRQTLFRKLKSENVTYEQILDSLRKKMALQYLNGEKVSVNETAYLVGFTDPASFSRAFKRWTGVSPRNLRTGQA